MSTLNRITALAFILSFLLVGGGIALPVFSAEESNEVPWSSGISMPTAGSDFESGVVNNKVYLINSSVTYEYDLNSWRTKSAMPTYRTEFATATYQNMIYCIGGRTHSGPEGANEVYDPDSDSWESKTAMPTPRHGMDANVVDGKIYLISGLVPENKWPSINEQGYGVFKLSDLNEVYDPATDTWTTKAPIPDSVSYYSSAVVNNKIYVFSEDFTQIYDPETDTWSYGARPLYPVDMAGAATVEGMNPQRIYLLGGRRIDLEVPFNQVYDVEQNVWSLGTSMLTARYKFGIAVVDNKIYTLGGCVGAYYQVNRTNINELYDPFGDKALPEPSLASQLNSSTPSISPTHTTSHQEQPTLPSQSTLPSLPPQPTTTSKSDSVSFNCLVILAIIVFTLLITSLGYFLKRRDR